MNIRIITAAALLALSLTPSLASAGTNDGLRSRGEDTAIDVCSDFNEYGPVELIGVIDDGMGDYMVWLEDVDGDLWGCNASDEGDIYANLLMGDDLLEGDGADMITLVGSGRNPARVVEKFCTDLADDNNVEVVATSDDGFGDYLIWLDAGDGSFIMCNASTEGELFAFETVSMPLNDVVEAPEDETTSVGRPTRPTGAGQFG